MSWTIEFSKNSDKFLNKHQDLNDDIIGEIKKYIHKLNGEVVNIDFKKMKGNWDGYYRIRKGQIRIILHTDTSAQIIYIEKIDYRGSVY